jgi:hypothetical protein
MPDLAKQSSPRPPPLPSPSAGSRGRAVDRARASLAIARLRLAERGRSLLAAARRRPFVASLAAAVLALAILVTTAVALDVEVPVLPLLAAKSLASASAQAKAHPDDAAAQRDLGHALWSAGKRKGAVAAYARALARDPGAADEPLAANLVAAFGTKLQDRAEALIVKHRVKGAAKGLVALTKSSRRSVRWAAVHTLDRIGEGTKRFWETAYIGDLDAPDCDVRRTAVAKLGEIGTPRAISALRVARADDEKTGGFLRPRCLGGRLDEAEQRILARR